MHGLAYDVGASMKSVPRTIKAPPVRVYEDALGGSFKATPYPQRIVRPSVVPPALPRRYEDQAGGSYLAGNPQRIVRPTLAAMRRK